MAKKMIIESVEQDSNELVTTIDKTQVVDFELNAEIVAGTLTTNAKELRATIENELKNYTIERYQNDSDAAKKDKAFLNKINDSVASKRKEITKMWNAPLDEFLTEMKTLEDSIKTASGAINDIVKEAENKEKNEKRERIEGFWKTLDFTLVSLDKIFNPKWLNKTTKFESVVTEIEAITEKITTELSTLRSMNDEDSEILQSFYLETLDLNATLSKGNQLKANREAIQKQNEAWKNEKLNEAAEKTVKALEKADLIPPVCTVTTAQNAEKNGYPEQKNNLMTFTLKLTGTREQLVALRKYIDDNHITYEKL